MKPSPVVALSAALFLSSLLGADRSAWADLKIVSSVTPSNGSPSTQISYFKNDKFRREDGKQISIFNCATGLVTFLDPEKRTYWSEDIEKVMDTAANDPMLARLKFDSTADATPT